MNILQVYVKSIFDLQELNKQLLQSTGNWHVNTIKVLNVTKENLHIHCRSTAQYFHA